MTILILSPPEDEHAEHMRRYLETQGEPVRFLNSLDFPGKLQITYDPLSGGGAFVFSDEVRVEFDEVKSVYWRSYAGVAASPLPDAERRAGAV